MPVLCLILPLVPTTLIGTALGVEANSVISREIFGVAIAGIIIFVGLNLIYRELKELKPVYDLEPGTRRGKMILVLIGLSVGFIGGIFGIGGPSISIPLLIFLGIPSLQAIGAGLVQGFFVTSSTAANYALKGNISADLVILVGTPYILSQIAGWYIAEHTEPRKLDIALGSMLLLLAPYLLLSI